MPTEPHTQPRILDITLPLRESMPVFEGDPAFRMSPVSHIQEDDPSTWSTSLLSLGTHTGTHVDPPRHFDNLGPDISDLDLHILCGPARVLDLRGKGRRIDSSLLASCDLHGEERILLRTDSEGWANDHLPFDTNYAHITLDAALWIQQLGIRLLGIDSPSVECFDSPGMLVHRTLLTTRPSVVVVEGLDLSKVSDGKYDLTCLPLNIVGGDGGPARAILRERCDCPQGQQQDRHHDQLPVGSASA